ncbi:MAG TPA: HD domain-containing protein [Spirochaetota bacterium]|nr:HD domain-containing protein [Spirochaetota bacterium]HNT12949.1 HD domain-containing protein [Spirochaetota bacterium]
MDRLRAQIAFIVEIDKLKQVLRRNYLADGSRRENDAEHSWFFATAALVLREHAKEAIDIARVVSMALIHDIVEIDAGDTFIYDTAARADQHEREERAAARLFGLLPDDQARDLRALWDEFEAGKTPEARYARAIDRLSAVLLNHASGGKAWREHGVPASRLREVNGAIADGSPAIWEHVRGIIDDAVARGIVADADHS